MRIVIEVDGAEVTGPTSPGAGGGTPSMGRDIAEEATSDAAIDGGGGPAGDLGGTEGVDAVTEVDTGPPPGWLLEAVAAAEVAGDRTGGLVTGSGADTDAGAGPAA